MSIRVPLINIKYDGNGNACLFFVITDSLRRVHCIGGCNSPSRETEKKQHRWRSDHRCSFVQCSVKKETRYETRKKKTRRDKQLGE